MRLWTVALWLLVPGLLGAQERLVIGDFSATEPGGLPEGWQPLHFEKIKRHTQYELEEKEGVVALCAQTQAAASGLILAKEFDLKKYPYLSWRWNVANLYDKSDIHTKAGDDYPVRLYVTFKLERDKIGWMDRIQLQAAKLIYGSEPPVAALNYIWATDEAVGLVTNNAYTKRAKMLVVESGPEHLNQWRSYSRNVLEDYRRAFGSEPPPVAGVAVMTDSDNTKESGRACYGDIFFSKQQISQQ